MIVSDTTASRSYSWLPVLLIVMAVVTLALGGITLHYLKTRMIATAGETLALTTAEVSDKLDRFLYERYADVLMMAGTFSAQPFTREFQSAYVSQMKILYPDYLWIGATNARGQIVLATEPATVGRDYSTELWFQAIRSGRAVHVGDVEPFAAIGGTDAIAFTAPITGSRGEFLGAVSTRVGVPELEHVLTETLLAFQQKMGFEGSLEYQFLTEKGVAFIDSDLDHKGNVNLKQLGLPSALASEQSKFGYIEEEHLRRHVPVITGYARTLSRGGFEGMRWTVLMRMDRRDVLAPIHTALWKLALASGAILVPTFGLLVWTAKRVRREHLLAQQENMHAREVEVSLRKSEARARCVVETALDAFIEMDTAGIITDWNIQAEQMFGWSQREAIGRSLSTTIIPAQDHEAYDRGLQQFLATGEGQPFNKRIEISGWHREGWKFPIEVSITPVLSNGQYTFNAFVRDISERKQGECRIAVEHRITQVLLELESLEVAAPEILKTVCQTLDWSVGVLWRVDEEMQVLRCVEVWSDQRVDFTPFIEGTRESNFAKGIGLPGRVWKSQKVEWIQDILCDDNFPRAPFARVVGLHAAFAFAITIDNRVYGVMEFFASTIREPDQKVLAMFHDLAGKLSQFLSRKHAERRLQQAKDRAELAAREKAQILATVEAFFIGVTDQGVVSEWTNRAEQIFGIALSDAIGRSLRDLPIAWTWDEILAALGKSGDTMRAVRIEKIRLTVAGMKEKFVKLTISPICEDRGIGYVIMGEDVTDRLLLEDELVQAQKLESIGHLAAGIAHEINTPTQFVGDNVRFLSDSFTDIHRLIEQYQRLLAAAKTGVCPEALIETCEAANRGADLEYLLAEIPKAIEQTVEGVGRVATIVRAMKEFSHPGSKEKASVNLNRAIESTVTVARNEWKYVADLQTNLDPSLPLVPCLVGEFNQVVLNMIVNATHAIADAVKGTGGKGTITICTSWVGDFVEVRISDTGLGIPESVRHKIFDPFFTTKEVGRGTGQGLAIARSVVVDKHGGTIDVESEVGKGTTFLIRLPLTAPSAESVTHGA